MAALPHFQGRISVSTALIAAILTRVECRIERPREAAFISKPEQYAKATR